MNLIPPYTDRRNNMDSGLRRFSGSAGCGRKLESTSYNLMNVDVVTAYNQTFVPGGPWLAPTALQPARYARLNLEFDS